jgi:hypothetical protein
MTTFEFVYAIVLAIFAGWCFIEATLAFFKEDWSKATFYMVLFLYAIQIKK